jgi:hypothetical protein
MRWPRCQDYASAAKCGNALCRAVMVPCGTAEHIVPPCVPHCTNVPRDALPVRRGVNTALLGVWGRNPLPPCPRIPVETISNETRSPRLQETAAPPPQLQQTQLWSPRPQPGQSHENPWQQQTAADARTWQPPLQPQPPARVQRDRGQAWTAEESNRLLATVRAAVARPGGVHWELLTASFPGRSARVLQVCPASNAARLMQC